jgi:hypothetical protein
MAGNLTPDEVRAAVAENDNLMALMAEEKTEVVPAEMPQPAAATQPGITPEDVLRAMDIPVNTVKPGAKKMGSMDVEAQDREKIMARALQIVKEENAKHPAGTFFGTNLSVAPVGFVCSKRELTIKIPPKMVPCNPHLVLDKSAKNGYQIIAQGAVGGNFVVFKNHKYISTSKYEIAYLKSEDCRTKNSIIVLED